MFSKHFNLLNLQFSERFVKIAYLEPLKRVIGDVGFTLNKLIVKNK